MPRMLASSGQEIETIHSEGGTPHLARVLSWGAGKRVAPVSPHSAQLLRSLGSVLGTLDRALEGFHHSGGIQRAQVGHRAPAGSGGISTGWRIPRAARSWSATWPGFKPKSSPPWRSAEASFTTTRTTGT